MKDDLRSLMLGDDAEPSASARVSAPVSTKIPTNIQAERDRGALAILQNELKASQQRLAAATDPQAKERHQADIAGLQREIGQITKTAAPEFSQAAMPVQAAPQPAPQAAPSGNDLRSLMGGDEITYKSTAGAGRGSYAGFMPPSPTAGAGRGTYTGYSEDERRALQVQKESDQRIKQAAQALYEVPRAIGQNLSSTVAKGFGEIVGGLLPGPEGQSLEYGQAAQKVIPEFEPQSPVSQQVLNLMNLPSEYVFNPSGKYLGDVTQRMTGSPTAGGVVQGLVEGAPMLLGLRGMGKKPATGVGQATIVPGQVAATDVPAILRKQFAEKMQGPTKPAGYLPPETPVEPTPTGVTPTGVTPTMMAQPQQKLVEPEITPLEKITDQQSIPELVASPPVPKGVSPEIQNQKSDVLKRVGFGDDEMRTSAVNGDALQAAIDANMAKFIDHPLGEAAYNQLAKERQKLVDFAEQASDATGGTKGMDQSSLLKRGRTIDAPFKKFGEWFDDQTNKLYKQADKTSAGKPVVDPSDIEAFLNDRTFNNKANASNQQNLVTAIKDQLESFKENNPEGLTVKNTEEFRKFLNSIWNKDNSSLIADVKEQVDAAVLKHAGEDIYAKGRNLWKLKKETLEDPKGIAKLFEFDPNKPLNRRTAFENIPDAVVNLDAEQYAHVINVLKNMPPELQPMAQKALSEIQAHHVNNMLAKGTTNAAKWNPKNVSTYRKDNSENIKMSFADNPKAMQMIDDLEAAGHILDYDPTYKGAASQAQSAMKRGFLTNLVGKGATTLGATTGSAMAGPIGAALGTAGGEFAGGKIMSSTEAAAAQKNWQKRMHKLSDIGKK